MTGHTIKNNVLKNAFLLFGQVNIFVESGKIFVLKEDWRRSSASEDVLPSPALSIDQSKSKNKIVLIFINDEY